MKVGDIVKYVGSRPVSSVHIGKLGKVIEVYSDAIYPSATVVIRFDDGTPDLHAFTHRVAPATALERLRHLVLGRPS
jgi:hypothetical protein